MLECVCLCFYFSKVSIYELIMITLKINIVATKGYYLLTLIIWSLKLKPKIVMKMLLRIKKCFILVIIQLSKSIMMALTN